MYDPMQFLRELGYGGGTDNGLMLNTQNTPANGNDSSMWSWGAALGSVDPKTNQYMPGWAGTALNSVTGLGNAWIGMKQYGLAKDQLKFQKDAFNKNFEVQKNLTNAQLADRQRTRMAERPESIPVDEYMRMYGVR